MFPPLAHGSIKTIASSHLLHCMRAPDLQSLHRPGWRSGLSAPTSHRLMARPRPAQEKVKTVAENRRARFDYFIEHTYEAGIALTGTEVKSLRFGEGSIA